MARSLRWTTRRPLWKSCSCRSYATRRPAPVAARVRRTARRKRLSAPWDGLLARPNWPDGLAARPTQLCMVNEFNNPPYLTWLPDAALHYLAVLGLLLLLGLIVGFLIAAVRSGPISGPGDMMYRLAASAGTDLVRFSPRRVFLPLCAAGGLKAVRRRVWVAARDDRPDPGIRRLRSNAFCATTAARARPAIKRERATSSIGETGDDEFRPRQN